MSAVDSIPGSGSQTGVALLGVAELTGILLATQEGATIRDTLFGRANTSGIWQSTAVKEFGIAIVAVIVATLIAGTSQAAARTMFVILLALGFVFLLTHLGSKSPINLPGKSVATVTKQKTTTKGGKSNG